MLAVRMRPLALTTAAASASLLVAAIAGTALAAPAAGGATGDTAMVSVFHGVPGLTVDVYANGKKLLPDFVPGTLTEPQALKAGSYDIEVFKAGADPAGTPAVEKTVDVPAGANATVVAHLSASGQPQLNAYVNDTSSAKAGKARLTVRHVAAAPAVDVRANKNPVFTDLQNPAEATGEVPAGTVSADVTLAGTETVAIGPANLTLPAGSSTVVYAWGSAADKNLALKVQSLHPTAVHAGEAGTAVATSGDTALAVAGGAGLAAAAAVLVVRRRTASHR